MLNIHMNRANKRGWFHHQSTKEKGTNNMNQGYVFFLSDKLNMMNCRCKFHKNSGTFHNLLMCHSDYDIHLCKGINYWSNFGLPLLYILYNSLHWNMFRILIDNFHNDWNFRKFHHHKCNPILTVCETLHSLYILLKNSHTMNKGMSTISKCLSKDFRMFQDCIRRF